MPTDLEAMAVKLRKHLLKRYVLDRSIWPGNETQIEADILDALRNAFYAGAAAMREACARDLGVASKVTRDSGELADFKLARDIVVGTSIRALEPRALREP